MYIKLNMNAKNKEKSLKELAIDKLETLMKKTINEINTVKKKIELAIFTIENENIHIIENICQ